MNVVLYARYSSDNQTEASIEGQIRECKSYCERNGMTVIKTYIDRAMSAKTDRRPDFQNLIRDSEKRFFEAIVVWKLDRFSRNRYDSAYYKRILRKNGVKVISATEPISDATLLGGLRRMGYDKESMTVHGFRSMASTLLNEQGYNRDWIERQLAHGERNHIRAAYNHAEFLPERRAMMQSWSDYLDKLRGGP